MLHSTSLLAQVAVPKDENNRLPILVSCKPTVVAFTVPRILGAETSQVPRESSVVKVMGPAGKWVPPIWHGISLGAVQP